MLYGYKLWGRAASGGLPFFLTIEAIFFNLYPFRFPLNMFFIFFSQILYPLTFILSPKNAILMA